MRTVEWDEGVKHVATRIHVRVAAAIPCDNGRCNRHITPGDTYVEQLALFDQEMMMSREHIEHFERDELGYYVAATKRREKSKKGA